MKMGITSLSSLSLERWWKFVYLYAGTFVYFVFVVALVLAHWSISNPKVNENFVLFFRENIFWIYLFLCVWLMILLSLLFLFVRLVHVQIDEDRGKVYIEEVERDKSKIKFISEMVVLDMLIVLIETDGKLKTWIPKRSPYRDTLWPLPFFYRKSPKNKYAKLLHSILLE